MTVDEWVSRLNKLARKMDEITATTHPTAWDQDDHLKKLTAQYIQLAKAKVGKERKL
ncbi:hypothetical protein [Desulfoscipio geothermicus]|uniref:hypothetical protein n=1 Tax=Desulfoscipio geothermicus TaxID=39060 RepID=UPI0013F4FA18|nr:hypothetical protein [Desulfoscipio geothermicus]